MTLSEAAAQVGRSAAIQARGNGAGPFTCARAAMEAAAPVIATDELRSIVDQIYRQELHSQFKIVKLIEERIQALDAAPDAS